ncbi:MAG: (Fe-S)-binding protein [Burkholderiales bacterium]|nr:(Fe-S)-binding protein [Burkholderiales bacterium]
MSERSSTAPVRSTLGPPEVEGVKALFQRERERILAYCTQCARCFQVCPMAQGDPALAAADPQRAVRGVIEILRGQDGTPEGLAWVQRCARSGVCEANCPEPISPKMMLRVAAIVALGQLGDPPRYAARQDPDLFNKVHAFARLTLTPEEIERWTVAPAAREPRES